ncbi:PQ loop repeat-domain-containing protein, partial [Mycotypha africana]|uniref:PQ loop repeat-domain-containing protein n=1 Tax=Mycotypha africana TaxID=64632 RepID=UPI002301D9E1
LSVGLSIAMIVGPVIGYIDQYFLIKRKQSSDGFNIMTCAILLFANVLRIFFWFGKRFEVTLLLQSIAMIITMVILLQVVVKYKHERRSTLDLFYNETGLFKSFWKWEYYSSYIKCITVFILVMAFLHLFLERYAVYVEILGYLSLGIESTLPLPQCISNFKNRSTHGFSSLVLATWFLGDSFKLFYFIFTEAPLQFIICGSIQLFIDSLIVLEFILF